MHLVFVVVVILQILKVHAQSQYTWPSLEFDEIDDLMYLQQGYYSRAFPAGVQPSWLRIAFYDAIDYNSAAGTGGIDASILFETASPANKGLATDPALPYFLNFYTIRTSMADLIALGVSAVVSAYGGPPIPVQGGRIDAIAAGSTIGPLASDTVSATTAAFQHAGFSGTDMIKLVACGHTIGGVHGADYPEITTATYAPFDATINTFDTGVIVSYLDVVTSADDNPLVVGPSATDSDLRIFSSDGNVTVESMSFPNTFESTCQSILTRMTTTVPSGTSLTGPITGPLSIKPYVSLSLAPNSSLLFSGSIRVQLTGRPDEDLIVAVQYRDASFATHSLPTAPVDPNVDHHASGSGFDFMFYDFFIALPTSSNDNLAGLHDFFITIQTPGNTETHNNNGRNFDATTYLLFERPWSCLVREPDAHGNWNLTVVAALQNSFIPDFTPLTLKVYEKVANSPSTSSGNHITPGITASYITMSPWVSNVGASGYSLFAGSYAISPAQADTTFDILTNPIFDEQEPVLFNFIRTIAHGPWPGLPGSCAPFV